MSAFISESHIIDSLKSYYGIEVRTFELLSLGADINAQIYKAVAKNNCTYFVKLKRHHQQENSVEIMELLQSVGIQHIIMPIKTTAGLLEQQIGNFILLVYPFIEGKDGFSRDLTDVQWVSLGETLSKIHGISIPPSILARIRRETYSPIWRERVRQLYKQPIVSSGYDESALTLLAILKEKRSEILKLVEHAEKLSQILQNQTIEFVLCHSDIHGGNVLISNDGSLFIVDWDEPVMAPKERDLMFIGAGVANVWNKQEEETAFYKGYGKTEINMAMLAYYRQERIVEDIAVYAEALLSSTGSEIERATMLKHFRAMFDPRGVVEIALITNQLASS